MQFFVTFLEGIISFISPCMLPLLPVYISYFSGSAEGENEKKTKTLWRAFGFVIGFTTVFCLLGLFAGSIGSILKAHQTAVNIVTGCIIILFGLSYLEIIRLPFFKGMEKQIRIKSVFSAFLFGVVYSVSLTPCVGAFLGSALAQATGSGNAFIGVLLLLTYSLGMGLPFLLSAFLLEQLSGAFRIIKSHYGLINRIAGILLIVLGALMATGLYGKIMIL